MLTALERVANGVNEAHGALVTWLVGNRQGWPQSRLRVPRSTWYKHLALLKKAGCDVPVRGRGKLPAGNGVRELYSGAGLLRIVGKRLRLIARYDRWQGAGTTGTVREIVFRDSEWLAGVQFDGSPGSYEEIELARFARIVEWI